MAPHTWSHLGDTVSDATHHMYYRGQRIKEAYYRGECIWRENSQPPLIKYPIRLSIYFKRLIQSNMGTTSSRPNTPFGYIHVIPTSIISASRRWSNPYIYVWPISDDAYVDERVVSKAEISSYLYVPLALQDNLPLTTPRITKIYRPIGGSYTYYSIEVSFRVPFVYTLSDTSFWSISSNQIDLTKSKLEPVTESFKFYSPKVIVRSAQSINDVFDTARDKESYFYVTYPPPLCLTSYDNGHEWHYSYNPFGKQYGTSNYSPHPNSHPESVYLIDAIQCSTSTAYGLSPSGFMELYSRDINDPFPFSSNELLKKYRNSESYGRYLYYYLRQSKQEDITAYEHYLSKYIYPQNTSGSSSDRNYNRRDSVSQNIIILYDNESSSIYNKNLAYRIKVESDNSMICTMCFPYFSHFTSDAINSIDRIVLNEGTQSESICEYIP